MSIYGKMKGQYALCTSLTMNPSLASIPTQSGQPFNDPNWPRSSLFSLVSVLSDEPPAINGEARRLWNNSVSSPLSEGHYIKGLCLQRKLFISVHEPQILHLEVFLIAFYYSIRFKETAHISENTHFPKHIS